MALVTSVGIILGLVLLGMVMDRGLPIRWEIPAGYRGWVVVVHEHPACPTLRFAVCSWTCRWRAAPSCSVGQTSSTGSS
jgi:hypothetical protein